MKTTASILFLFTIATLVTLAGLSPANSQSTSTTGGRFQLVAISNEDAAQVYRIDTYTGDTDRLVTQTYQRQADNQSVTLTGWKPVRSLIEEANASAQSVTGRVTQ